MCSLDIWVLYRIYWPFKELIYHSSKCRYAHSDVQPSRKHLSNTCYLLDTMLDGGETKMIKFSPCPWAAHILGTGAIRDVFLCNYYIPSDRSKPRLWQEHQQGTYHNLRNKEASSRRQHQAEWWGGHSRSTLLEYLDKALKILFSEILIQSSQIGGVGVWNPTPNMFVWPMQYWSAEFLFFIIDFIVNILK